MKSLKDKTIFFTCAGYGGGLGKMLRFVSSICVDKFQKVYLQHRGRGSNNDIIPDGVEEIVLPIKSRCCSFLWRLEQIHSIRKEIKRISPSIVCCFGTEQAVMVAIAMIGMDNIKLIQCDRTDPYTSPLLWIPLKKWAFARADKCVFQLEKQGKWYGSKIMSRSVVIPNPFIPTGNIINFEGKRKKTIVSVGRFVYEKRFEILISAFDKVHIKHPEYKLIIYGDGPYREKYESIIDEYKLQEFVEMPGYTNDTMNSIRDAGIFVLSSLYEGIPNSLIEALALGIPTVSTDCTPGGPDYLTDHGRRGLLVPVDDVNLMAVSICSIIENPQLASELSLKGKEIIPLLDKKRISNSWINIFKQC